MSNLLLEPVYTGKSWKVAKVAFDQKKKLEPRQTPPLQLFGFSESAQNQDGKHYFGDYPGTRVVLPGYFGDSNKFFATFLDFKERKAGRIIKS